MSMQRRNYARLGRPAGPYAHAVRHGGLLHLSGLTASGTPAEEADLPSQAEAVLERMAGVAADEGRDLSSLLKVTLFVTTLDGIDALRTVLSARYGDTPPASSLVRVAGLYQPNLKIEIEALLALD